MNFSKAALSLIFVTSQVSAWSTRVPSRSRHLAAVQLHSLATNVQGEEKTESFRMLFKEGDKQISPWHDIDLKNADGSYNMVCSLFLYFWRLIFVLVNTTSLCCNVMFPIGLTGCRNP
jgi:hypothetical protein